jgi:predicted phage terminase large subunit-like protein
MIDKDIIINKIMETEAALVAAKKEFYSQSEHLYEFERDILGWPDIYEPLHRRVCDFITENINTKQLLILLPRGVFKSSLVTVGFSTYTIVTDPKTRIFIGNATYPMATQFLSQIKNQLQRNEPLKRLFGNLAESADSWREDRIYVAREKSYEQKDPTVWAYGIGGNFVGSHFDMAILDDLVSRENISTKEQIEKVKNAYRDSLDLIDPQPNGHKRVIIIGTCWHWDDLYAWIMQDPNLRDDFAVLRLPAYEGEFGSGKLLFPTRLSWKVLGELKRKQGSYHFASQYLLDPIPTEDQVFKGPFKTYEETDIRGIDLRRFVTLDPAISEKKDADYSAMVCVGVDKNNTWYILDVWRDKVQPKALIDQIFYWNEKWKPITFGIEVVAFQKALQYFILDEMKKRNNYVPIKELKHADTSKDERIRGLQPRYEVGSILHPQQTTIPAIEYLEDELKRFPRAKHDDLLDALASQLELVSPPRAREERSEVARSHYPA